MAVAKIALSTPVQELAVSRFSLDFASLRKLLRNVTLGATKSQRHE